MRLLLMSGVATGRWPAAAFRTVERIQVASGSWAWRPATGRQARRGSALVPVASRWRNVR